MIGSRFLRPWIADIHNPLETGGAMSGKGLVHGNPPMWLESPPDGERLRNALDALARLCGLDPALPPGPRDAFDRGMAGIRSGSPDVVERGRNWVWVAAAMGVPGAVDELVLQIARSGPACRAAPPAHALFALVGDWLQHRPADPARPRRGSLPHRVDASDYPEFEEALPDMPEDPVDVRDASAGRVVIEAIGDPLSKDGRAISKRFQHFIAVPMAFKGHIPDPADLCRDFLERFPWAPGMARYLRGQFALLRTSGGTFPTLPSLLLVGPPGCGKTTMLEWISSYCGFPTMTLPIGGTTDSGGLAAVVRGWDTARASAPVQLMADQECANPCLILDEIDKGVHDTTNKNGSVAGTLLAMLRPPAEGYRDPFFMAPVDISHVTFMASANSLAPVSQSILGRFIVQRVEAPGPQHFDRILEGVTVSSAQRLCVPPEMLPWITPGDRAWLKSVFVRGRCDIRSLEQAHQILVGDLAAEEEMAMRRPH